MKKITIVLLILTSSIVSLFSAMSSAGSTFAGFAGIPVGSIYYQGGSWDGNGTNWTQEKWKYTDSTKKITKISP